VAFAVRDGVLRTAATGVLEGVTRKVLLQLAGQLGIPVSLQPVHREGIGELSEAAISSSSRALIPAVRIAGQQVGNGRPGPICRRLLAAYRAYVETAVRPALPRS